MSQQHDATTRVQDGESRSDRQLADMTRTSPDTFAVLCERYLDGIYAFCKRRVNSRQAVEDLTSTVFERALTRIDTYRGGSFRAGLFRIAHNAVTDHYRRRRNLVSWKPHMSGPDDDLTPEDHAIASNEQAHLQQLMETLTGINSLDEIDGDLTVTEEHVLEIVVDASGSGLTSLSSRALMGCPQTFRLSPLDARHHECRNGSLSRSGISPLRSK